MKTKSKDIDLSKATPRPWIKTSDYRIKAERVYTNAAGDITSTYASPIVVARANQSYRRPEEDAANVELCFRAVNFMDSAMESIEEILSSYVADYNQEEEPIKILREAIEKFKEGE